MEKFYITTPIYYPSGKFHIGTAYTEVVAGTMKKYRKQKGYDTYLLTGLDEHGQKIQTVAEKAGKTPQEHVDEMAKQAKELWELMKIDYNYFIRTTEPRHQKVVQEVFEKLLKQGDIYKGSYEGLYCMPCESYFTETQLVNGKCPDCGRDVVKMQEEAYFFNMKKYTDKLLKYYEEHPDFIQPAYRKTEMINNFIKPGLEDLCVTRTTFDWGIKVPSDPKHVIYVWIDALSNYITALGYMSDDDSLFKKYWPANLHLVGKEIIRFHTIIWPALLMALDLPLPDKVFGHGWLVIDGGKISKSLGNYKDPREYINDYGVDAVRYFVLREVSFGNDGSFSEDALVARTNADLANVLGNLVNRTISMSKKYFDGVVTNGEIYEKVDNDLINTASNLYKVVDNKMESLHISDALDCIFDLLRKCNKYIDDTAPWVLFKNEEMNARLSTVLYNLLECIRISSVLLFPFIPTTSMEIFKQLNTNETSYESVKKYGRLEKGIVLNDPKPLFMRIDLNKEK